MGKEGKTTKTQNARSWSTIAYFYPIEDWEV